MSDLLSIGASGVRAYQTALATTSENIANAGNPTYVRRATTITEVSAPPGASSTLTGMGVTIDGISRASNEYADTALRNASADLARTEAGQVWLERIETALGSGAVSGRLNAFFAAGTALQADPTSSALRAGMLSAATSVADSFGVTGRALDEAMTELDTRATQSSADLTRLNQTMLQINQGLVRTQPGSAANAGLSDQRADILAQMSELTDISVTLDDFGRATVRASGPNGPVLVDPREANEVGYARTGGNVALTVRRADTQVSVFDPDGGALAGMSEGAQRIAAARDELGRVATDLTTTMNDLQTQGEDLKGVKGTAFFASNPLDPIDFSVVLASGDGIAAAGSGGGTRDASNLAKLATERGTQAFEARTQSLVTDNAATLKQRRLVGSAQTAIRDGAANTRSTISGVNMDNEAIDLLKFQQAYQASSRVIQVAKEIFQSILEIR